MAGQIPDPRGLNSWEDAFQQPLPVVRKLEAQLRKQIDDNRQKLRSLVGASYRDLLGTAERIIEMDGQMETVETYVGDIGGKCNARTVEKIGENQARMQRVLGAGEEARQGAMAQTRVLQRALMMGGRVIKGGGDALLASKLFVLARLLCKSVSESAHAPSVLEEFRRKLAVLRKKLLSYIERTMGKLSADKSLQAHTLSAYALVTSSTPKEVLRHFLQVRYGQLERKSETPSAADMLQMLELFSQTMLDTRDLFPRRFADSLAQLAKVPLLQDEQVQSVFELNLDVYGRWIAADVRAFTPWVRHEQLTASEVASALESWSRQAQQFLLQGLQDRLANENDARTIVETRQKVLSKYMALSSKLRNDAHLKAIHDLREAFLTRLEELAAEAASISHLKLDESDIASADDQDSKPRRIWDLATENFDMSQGATKFRQAIVQTRHGRTLPIEAETEKLDSWVSRIHGLLDHVDEMRVNNWDHDVDFEIEDLDDSDALIDTLTKEDPERLQSKLRDAAEATLRQIIIKIESSAAATNHAAFYLRIWREVDQRRRALETRLTIPTGKMNLNILHRQISHSVSKDPLQEYLGLAKASPYVPAPVALWDNGTPALPIQPSPAAFSFLTSLHRAMGAAGTDLWTAACVWELKGVVLETLGPQLDDPRNFTQLSDDDAGRREKLVQNLFDVYYLSRALSRPDVGGVASAIEGTLEMQEREVERLRRGAGEFWRRTGLLFGLLNPRV